MIKKLLWEIVLLLFPISSYSLGTITFETTEQVASGITHIHRQYQEPLENIHILKIDLTNRNISFGAVLGGERIGHPERVSSMVKRTGAIAGVNGDYWSGDSIYAAPEGIMVSDGELITAPKYRTAIGITKNNKIYIQKWTDKFEWDGEIVFPNGQKHHINLLNRWDLNDNSMILYTRNWSAYSFGTIRGIPETEILFRPHEFPIWNPRWIGIRIKELRVNKPGIPIVRGQYYWEDDCVLSGRGESANWLIKQYDDYKKQLAVPYDPTNGTCSDCFNGPHILQNTTPMWSVDAYSEVSTIDNAISAGPLIIDNGSTYHDPIMVFSTESVSEDFTVQWKKDFYPYRHPRTSAGITKDGKTLILLTVDGRQKNFSAGFTRSELAEYMISLGTYRAMELDSGGSSTMVIKDSVVNHPSDRAKFDGTGGIERKVINSLCIYHKEWKEKVNSRNQVGP